MTQVAPDPTEAAPRSSLCQRRRGLVIAAAIALIVVITVLTDLPVPTSRASDVSAERSVMTEVNGDLDPCASALHQALGIWTLQAEHQLTPADRAPTPGLLSDDQAACSLANEGIYDLSDIQVPETPAGKHVGDMVGTALLWTTSDALRAIEDVQTLMAHPDDAPARRNLTTAESELAADRQHALVEERAANRSLGTTLQPVDLPSLASPDTSG